MTVQDFLKHYRHKKRAEEKCVEVNAKREKEKREREKREGSMNKSKSESVIKSGKRAITR